MPVFQLLKPVQKNIEAKTPASAIQKALKLLFREGKIKQGDTKVLEFKDPKGKPLTVDVKSDTKSKKKITLGRGNAKKEFKFTTTKRKSKKQPTTKKRKRAPSKKPTTTKKRAKATKKTDTTKPDKKQPSLRPASKGKKGRRGKKTTGGGGGIGQSPAPLAVAKPVKPPTESDKRKIELDKRRLDLEELKLEESIFSLEKKAQKSASEKTNIELLKDQKNEVKLQREVMEQQRKLIGEQQQLAETQVGLLDREMVDVEEKKGSPVAVITKENQLVEAQLKLLESQKKLETFQKAQREAERKAAQMTVDFEKVLGEKDVEMQSVKQSKESSEALSTSARKEFEQQILTLQNALTERDRNMEAFQKELTQAKSDTKRAREQLTIIPEQPQQVKEDVKTEVAPRKIVLRKRKVRPPPTEDETFMEGKVESNVEFSLNETKDLQTQDNVLFPKVYGPLVKEYGAEVLGLKGNEMEAFNKTATLQFKEFKSTLLPPEDVQSKLQLSAGKTQPKDLDNKTTDWWNRKRVSYNVWDVAEKTPIMKPLNYDDLYTMRKDATTTFSKSDKGKAAFNSMMHRTVQTREPDGFNRKTDVIYANLFVPDEVDTRKKRRT